MNATDIRTQVGEKVIVTKKWGEEPSITFVTKVTKTGRFRVDGFDVMFMPMSSIGEANAYAGMSSYSMQAARVYEYSVHRFDQLRQRAAEVAAQKDEARRERAAEIERRRQEEAGQLAETETVVKFSDFSKHTLPDGSRLYQGDVPLRKDEAYRKYLFVMIRCMDSDPSMWFDDNDKIEAEVTYLDNRGGSFVSCSTTRHQSDEEAVMQSVSALRYR